MNTIMTKNSSRNAPSQSLLSSFAACSRSHRWRAQIGLLSPNDGEDNENSNAQRIAKRRATFEQYQANHPFPTSDDKQHQAQDDEQKKDVSSETETPPNNNNDSDSDFFVDPLTAMMRETQEREDRLQQLDLQYRKERARRKRQGTTTKTHVVVAEDEDYDESAVTLQIIDKDLNRLPAPGDNNNNNNDNDDTSSTKDTHRLEILRQVLFIYSCQHPEPGYRQGMHEIASFLLYSLELDCSTTVVDDDNNNNNNNKDSARTMLLASECYFMLEHILTAVQPAYDVKKTTTSSSSAAASAAVTSGESPLQAMSRRILEWIARAGDVHLWQRLNNDLYHVPPAMYLTKWMRLLFSREVVDTQSVLELWDAFFACVSAASGGGYTWMTVLEATAAARLLLHRQEILQATKEEAVALLMNLTVEKDISLWVDWMEKLLAGQSLNLPPIAAAIPIEPGAVVPATATATTPSTPTHQANQKNTDVLTASMKKLSSVKESLTSKTQSISKRLYQEWENISEKYEDPLRSYDDPAWHAAAEQHALGGGIISAYSSNSMGAITAGTTAAAAATTTATTSPTRAGEPSWLYPPPPPPPQQQQRPQPPTTATPMARRQQQHHQWGHEMELRLAILQDFCMTLERQKAKSVPEAVWEALADLQVLRQDIVRHEDSDT